MGFIYRTTNKINGKFYIGKSIVEKKQHQYLGSGIYLKRAVRKYGRQSFYKEILEVVDDSQLDARERFWIEKLKAKNYGYNISDGGEGGATFTGRKHTEETKRIIKEKRAKQKRNPLTKEHKEKLRKAALGNKSRINQKTSEDIKLKISNGLKRYHSRVQSDGRWSAS